MCMHVHNAILCVNKIFELAQFQNSLLIIKTIGKKEKIPWGFSEGL